MKTARCLDSKCGLTIRGRFPDGPPMACPYCGFKESKEVLRKAISAELTQENKK